MRDYDKKTFYPGACVDGLGKAYRNMPHPEDERNDERMNLLVTRTESLIIDVMRYAGFAETEIEGHIMNLRGNKDRGVRD